MNTEIHYNQIEPFFGNRFLEFMFFIFQKILSVKINLNQTQKHTQFFNKQTKMNIQMEF